MDLLDSAVLHFPALGREPFWIAMQQQRLQLQRCAACGNFLHYPRVLCDLCFSENTEIVDACGFGTLCSWTTIARAFHPVFQPDVPYTVGLVLLEEGVRILGHISQVSGTTLRAGMPMRFSPVKLSQGYWVPGFVAAADLVNAESHQRESPNTRA
jgi:uncharacterized protein